MPKELPWFQFYPVDWLTSPDVCAMTGNEVKGYINLLCHCWLSQDCGLPSDDKTLSVLSGLSAPIRGIYDQDGKLVIEWDQASAAILAKFELIKDRFYNHKLLDIFKKQKEKREAQAVGAQTTNSNRIGKRHSKRHSKRSGNSISIRSVRASDSDTATAVSSDSVSLNGGSGGELPQLGGDYPLTIAEIRSHDAAVDDFFVAQLAAKVTQHCMDHPKFPKDKLNLINDKSLSAACAHSYETWKSREKPHGTGLLLNRVPAIMVSWSQEDSSV